MARTPIFVRVKTDAVFAVADKEAVHAAAASTIAARSADDYTGGIVEQRAELMAAQTDLVSAVLEMTDPASMLEHAPGVEERSSTTGVDLCDENGTLALQVPDFGKLFAPCGCHEATCVDCGGWELRPRMAAVLWMSARGLADEAYDDVLSHGDEPVSGADWNVFNEYPRITYRQNAVWRRQAARAFDDLADDLAFGRWPEPRCPSEEMALRLILNVGEQTVKEEEFHLLRDVMDGLPHHEDDFQWDVASEVLFQDDDLSELFQADRDGIEDPDTDTNRQMGIGDYRAQAWFDWFGTAEPRDGRRPFRR